MFLFWRTVKVLSYEVGLHFRDGEFVGLIGEGTHRLFDPFGRSRVEVVSRRAPQLVHEKLDLIVRSGKLKGEAAVVDLKDDQPGAGLGRRPVLRRPDAGALRLLDRAAARSASRSSTPDVPGSSTTS